VKPQTNKMEDRAKYGKTEKTVRSAMSSAWNSLKYGKTRFELKASFSESSPVWLLGKHYHRRKMDDADNSEIAAFESDFSSRLLFTYRKDLVEFPGSGLTSDCGWGCMIRSGQMMLAQALVVHCLGRDWRNHQSVAVRQTSVTDRIQRDIIRLFSDIPDFHAAPLSIHNLVRLGRNIGKKAGDWFGPASVAHLLQLAVANAQDSASLLNSVAVYVSQDCTVYREDIIEICTVKPATAAEVTIQDFAVLDAPGGSEENTLHYSFSEEVTVDGSSWCLEQDSCRVPDVNWKSLVLLVPVRLGGEKFNELYSECLRSLLTLPSCLGWVGGRPSHSLYFIGFQENQLIHLDPHRLHPRIDTSSSQFDISSFHSANPRKLAISKMDPSCCLGFYLRTRDEFESWCQGISEFSTPLSIGGRPSYPIFTVVSQGRGDETMAAAFLSSAATANLSSDRTNMTSSEATPSSDLTNISQQKSSDDFQSEEFVFL